ncbi:MFS transporter [Rouxiella silvae]|uniref:MFS transporter n=1 Tax=Rouxiella silvae TaxID=1646373 RepID=A0AA41BWN3_9GAMM|nr:MFS transporter [Rouxiella silvae]MBF6637246.1 MFS transporter [Rouxiella silvae]
MTSQSEKNHTGISKGLLILIAIACGITVANVYLSQPILNEIALSFHASAETASLVTTMAQVGYAIGILFLVPCADSLSGRKLSTLLLISTTLALIACGFAPSLQWLVAASLLLTMFTVIPQVLIPLAVSLAEEGKTGVVIGTVQTGLIMGILLSRTLSGFLADFSHTWRASYIFAAVLNALLLIIVTRMLPDVDNKTLTWKRYAGLITSMPGMLIKFPALLLSALLGFLVFGAFSAFWATLAYYLSSDKFHMGLAAIGLFGLWGAPGALIAPRMGKLSDRYGVKLINIISIFAVFAAFLLFALPHAYVIAALVVGVNLLDFGLQSGQISNQARIFKMPGEYRARLNTVYMVFTFLGGAMGAAIGSYIWVHHGWAAVCLFACFLLVLALIILLVMSPADKKRRA